MQRLSLEEMVRLSSHVVQAECTEVESSWNAAGTLIFSKATFRVQSMMKGEMDGELISVYVPGGSVGDTTVIAVGAPTLEPGEEAMLMLSPARAEAGRPALGPRSFNLVGLSQGKFELRLDPDTNSMTARSSALKFFSGADARLLPSGGPEGWPVRRLVRSVRRLARQR